MSATATARDHFADLIKLKEATAEMLVETRHAASVGQRAGAGHGRSFHNERSSIDIFDTFDTAPREAGPDSAKVLSCAGCPEALSGDCAWARGRL